MEIDPVKARRGKKDRIAIPSMDRLLWLDSMHENKGEWEKVMRSFVQR